VNTRNARSTGTPTVAGVYSGGLPARFPGRIVELAPHILDGMFVVRHIGPGTQGFRLPRPRSLMNVDSTRDEATWRGWVRLLFGDLTSEFDTVARLALATNGASR
jgi:hypothetical protein